MTAVVNMVPEGYFQNKDLERMLIEIRRVAEQDEVMRSEQAEVYLKVSRTTLNVMCRKGLPYHTVPGLGGKIFLRSELIEFIKKH